MLRSEQQLDLPTRFTILPGHSPHGGVQIAANRNGKRSLPRNISARFPTSAMFCWQLNSRAHCFVSCHCGRASLKGVEQTSLFTYPEISFFDCTSSDFDGSTYTSNESSDPVQSLGGFKEQLIASIVDALVANGDVACVDQSLPDDPRDHSCYNVT